MQYLIKYKLKTKFLYITIALLVYLLCKNSNTCLGDGAPFILKKIPHRDNTNEEVSEENDTVNNFVPENSDKDLIYNFLGIIGSSSFNGETSLVTNNYIGLKLSAVFHEQSIHAYQQGTAQSFNSGISDYASSQSTFNYSNTFFQILNIDGGISLIRSNSTINSQTTVFYAGIKYFQGDNWNLGTRFYIGKYWVSVAKDIQTKQVSPFLTKNTYLTYLGTNLKFRLAWIFHEHFLDSSPLYEMHAAI